MKTLDSLNHRSIRRLGSELEGVIADVEQGAGFDDICLNTVKFVRDALYTLSAEIAELKAELAAANSKNAE